MITFTLARVLSGIRGSAIEYSVPKIHGTLMIATRLSHQAHHQRIQRPTAAWWAAPCAFHVVISSDLTHAAQSAAEGEEVPACLVQVLRDRPKFSEILSCRGGKGGTLIS